MKPSEVIETVRLLRQLADGMEKIFTQENNSLECYWDPHFALLRRLAVELPAYRQHLATLLASAKHEETESLLGDLISDLDDILLGDPDTDG